VYKIRLKPEEKRAIQGGGVAILLAKLRESEATIVRELKTPGSDTAFLQGASSIVDKLINVLEGA